MSRSPPSLPLSLFFSPLSLFFSSLSLFSLQGVEPEQCPSFTRSLEAGYPVLVKPKPTLADGLAVPKVGPAAFATAKDNIDSTILVR